MTFARQLRQRMTLPERILWYAMRDRRFFGYKIRRQTPRGPYILDFVCFERRLIIEVDGGSTMGARLTRCAMPGCGQRGFGC
jgi:very-short-patch-repair endonuclease